jgi:hypothetical protein
MVVAVKNNAVLQVGESVFWSPDNYNFRWGKITQIKENSGLILFDGKAQESEAELGCLSKIENNYEHFIQAASNFAWHRYGVQIGSRVVLKSENINGKVLSVSPDCKHSSGLLYCQIDLGGFGIKECPINEIKLQASLHISFGWTSQYLPEKSQTRRKWKDSHAAKFQKAFEKGFAITAYDKYPRCKGIPIGWIILNCAPYKQKLFEMSLQDMNSEGDEMCGSTLEFAEKYFEGNISQEVWVVDFHFVGNEEWHKNLRLRISRSSQELEGLSKQSKSVEEELALSSSLKSTPTHSESSKTNTQESPSTATSETTTPPTENLISTQLDSPVPEHPTQEAEPDYITTNPDCGSKHCDASKKENQNSSSSNSQKELSITDYEQFLEDSEWQDIVDGIYISYQQRKSERSTSERDYSLLPTLTSNSPTKNSRPSGMNKLEKWFRDNEIIPISQCLSGEAMEAVMGFPLGYTAILSESPKEASEDCEEDTSSDVPLFPNKQRSQSPELNTLQTLQALESYSEVSSCEEIFQLPNDIEGEDLSKDDVFALVKQINGSVKALPCFAKFSYNLVRLNLIKIDKRNGWKAFRCTSMSNFLEEKHELFDKGYSTLQKEWQAAKLEVDILRVKVGTLPENQCRELYPLQNHPQLLKSVYEKAIEKGKVTAKLLREMVSQYADVPESKIKKKSGWVAGPEGTRHYQFKIAGKKFLLQDAYDSQGVIIEKLSEQKKESPESLLAEGFVEYIANLNQTTHAGALAEVINFLSKNNSDQT